jgi:hypothetical protein
MIGRRKNKVSTMKLKNFTFGTILLSLAALVNLARWTGLFTFSDHAPVWVREVIPVLDTISGLFTGLAIAGSLAFVSHRLGMLQPFTPKGKPIMRFWGALVSELLILVLSAFLLPPYIRMTTPAELRAEIGDLKTWSVMAVLVGDLIIVAIALADGKSAGFTRSKSERPQKTRSEKRSGRSATPSKARATFPCHYAPSCERTFTSQNAANAHARTCEFKPTISMPTEEKVTRK